MNTKIAILLTGLVALGTGVPAAAQDAVRSTSVPNLVGTWTGKADFMLPEGLTHQIHHFEFETQDGAFLKGKHGWQIPAENLKSHDGKSYTYASVEPFLGVIGHDGKIWVVENGDTTEFHLKLIDADTLELIGLEGGAHPLVGRGLLTRD